jgi:putative transcriptional regulator
MAQGATKKTAAAMLREAHDNMSGLHKLGLIDKQTMSEFDEMCLPKVDVLGAEEIRELREAQNVSQSVFAAYLNTTKSTVSKWEQGDKKPNGIAQRLLNIIRDKGLTVIS